uniref:Voltage-dependent anion-selective channel n=1 Tax=Lygus hesperus TaxID=30085 RepID=A0A0A9YBY0_LYGHE
MGPPFFADLGKNSRDIFNKGYNFGLLKLDIKTRTETGVEFEIGGVQNLETKNVAGSLETKYKFKDFGISFSEKWNTDNVLQLEVAAADICEGVKMSCMSIMTPSSDEEKGGTDKILRFKNEYKNAIMAVNLESDFKAGGPTLGVSGVFGLGGWLLGAIAALDTETSKVMTFSLGMGFLTKDFILNTAVINKGTDFTGSIYHKVNDKLELGVFITWSADINVSESGVGCKYMVDADTALRFKVNNQAVLGAAYTHKLKEGISVGLCAQVNGKALKDGGSKLGFCLELEN